ncbi:copper resistance protein CopC [Peribacillus cavernae]|uniref:Copper resistance protein CopC n=1 Tax=Peribacillus cavernae TaxID=1674310 RepID=A0A433HE61_9BACI|nr:copper resistance protein CopC [Peribacillus cavernae]MDQ0219917.1 LPXTG-motif cell wall-anchored protein [Peribacillus cavernae]RUQ26601.1 copper resistance protein CopC [Peribacillus cavernae]
MRKFSLIVTLIALLIIKSIPVEAHTGLASSTPDNGEVLKKSLHEIVLHFETDIESLSTMKLFDESNKEIPLQGVTVEKNVMSASIGTPLNNGSYKINWNIVGKDGHVIQGDIPFQIAQEEEKQAVKPESEIKKETPTQNQPEKKNIVNEDKETPIFTYIIIGFVVLLIVGFLLLRRKR